MPSRPQFPGNPHPFPASPLPDLSLLNNTTHIRKIHRNKVSLVVGLGVGGSVSAAIAFLLFLLLLYRRLTATKTKKTSPFSERGPTLTNSVNLRKFSYRELKAATRSFDNGQKLGQGGFGAVYRGRLRDGREIAVKLLDATSLQGEREFQNEVSVIGKVGECPHVVALLGFCKDNKRGRRLLVYEYMQNRSLQDALFDDSYPVQLDWRSRFRIVVDTAKALAFLHGKCDPPIIHGDVKPSNILLDGSFSAKIADFGLARFRTEPGIAEDLEAQARVEKDRRYRRKEQRNEKAAIQEESVMVVEEELDSPAKGNLDGDPCGIVNLQSPDTFVSNSPTEENLVFLSSNAASPEGLLQYETDTVTTQDERTPSEIVDLEKNTICNVSADPRKGKEGKSAEFSREDDDKTSVSEGCFDKASVDSGRRRRKDWWWRQDSLNGESRVKDYVMEWIGTEIKKEGPKSSSWGNEEGGGSNPVSAKKTEKKKQRRKESVEWWTTLAEENKEAKKKEKSKSGRQSREWWREEYCDELSKKTNSNCSEWWENGVEEDKKRRRNKGRSRSRSRDWWREEQHNHHCGDGGSAVSLSSTPSTRGTVCYVAPEYGGGGALSEKSDVYSFGVVMLVVISGRRPLQVMASPIMELERANLISWARHLARSGGNVVDLVDDALGGDFDKEQALLSITVALLCLQRSPAARPSMSEVVMYLVGEVEAPPMPVEFSPSPPYGLAFRSRRKSSRAASTRHHPQPPPPPQPPL